MLFIPDWLTSIFTFPGVIVHEWAHKKFCDLFGVRVYKVVYFQPKNLAGYVTHERVSGAWANFWISFGPLMINSVLGVGLGYAAAVAPFASAWKFVLLWLAFSVGARAFPSDQDALNVVVSGKEGFWRNGSLLGLLAYPLFVLVWLANKLRFFWFDYLYAVALIVVAYSLRNYGIL